MTADVDKFFESLSDENIKSVEQAINSWTGDFNVLNNYGQTPLTYCWNSPDTIKLLLKAGADVNAKDGDGITALMAAGSAEVKELLLTLGADVNASSTSGSTALMTANYSPEISKLLIDAGAEVNAKNEHGGTALMGAFDPDITQVLLDADADVNAKTTQGFTALMGSYWGATTRLLIEKGAEVDAKDKDGNTAITYIFDKDYQAERSEILGELIKAGADVNAINNDKNTPLINLITSEYDSQDQEFLMKPLIKAGADINYAGRDDRKTPLMLVTKMTQAEILINAGADLTLRDVDGKLAHEQKHFNEYTALKKIRSYLENAHLTQASLLHAANTSINKQESDSSNERERL